MTWVALAAGLLLGLYVREVIQPRALTPEAKLTRWQRWRMPWVRCTCGRRLYLGRPPKPRHRARRVGLPPRGAGYTGGGHRMMEQTLPVAERARPVPPGGSGGVVRPKMGAAPRRVPPRRPRG